MSLWNTMMGTSLLAMPWGVMMAGLLGSCFVFGTMGGIAVYTALLIGWLHVQQSESS